MSTRSAAAPRSGLLTGATRGARAELLRLRKWPAVWITLGAWLLLNLMFGYLFNYLSYTGGTSAFADEGATKASLLAQMLPANAPNVFIQGMPMFGGALMMVLGAMVAGNGYGWGTWKTVFAQGTHRSAVVVGSLVALTVFVIATLAVALSFDLGVSVLVATTESQQLVMPSAGSLVEAVGTGFLVLEMWSLLGYALGTVARGPALAVGLGLVWALVVENLLRGVGQLLSWVETLTTVLPGTAAGSLVGSVVGVPPGGSSVPGVLDSVPGTRAALTLAAYVVVAAMATVVVVRRRDVS